MRPNQQDDQDSFTHLGNMYTYLDADDRQRGPFSLSQLISWCADGRLLPTTRVRQQQHNFSLWLDPIVLTKNNSWYKFDLCKSYVLLV